MGGFAVGIFSLSVIRAVNGVFAASIIPVTISLIGEKYSYNPKVMQKALGKSLGMLFLGAAAAPLIAGVLSHLVSWQMVYFTYGFAILVTAITINRTMDNYGSRTVDEAFGFKTVYKEAFADKRLMKLVGVEFFLGFSVLGSFMYSGDFVEQVTGYNIFWVGMALTFFGAGTVIGGRLTAYIKEKLGNNLFLFAGILGLISWGIMGFLDTYYFIIISFLCYGFSFIFLHAHIVAAGQKLLPGKKGLVMSLISFNLFAGGGIGTLVNSYILNVFDFIPVFLLAGLFIFVAGFLIYSLKMWELY